MARTLLPCRGIPQVPRFMTSNSCVHIVGFPSWKRRAATLFFKGRKIRFISSPSALPRRKDLTVATWGMQIPKEDFPEGSTILRVEDGFLRSVGLGAAYIQPISWIVDSKGIYFDSRQVSDLEHLLQHHEFSRDLLQRAGLLRRLIVSARLTKYNLTHANWIRPSHSGRVILVPGQVESDASLRHGAPNLSTNIELLRAVREANPAAFILYKPHPDVAAGFRSSGIGEKEAADWCDEILENVCMVSLLETVDEVHTLTSLAGFEALLRGRRVVTYGQPFYAGWGLTEDNHPVARRTRRLDLDTLVAAALLCYPLYLDWESQRLTTAEQALAQLQHPSADNSRKGADVLESLGRFLCRFRAWRKILAK